MAGLPFIVWARVIDMEASLILWKLPFLFLLSTFGRILREKLSNTQFKHKRWQRKTLIVRIFSVTVIRNLACGVVGHEATYVLFYFFDSIRLRGKLKDRNSSHHVLFVWGHSSHHVLFERQNWRTSLTGLASGYGFHNFSLPNISLCIFILNRSA